MFDLRSLYPAATCHVQFRFGISTTILKFLIRYQCFNSLISNKFRRGLDFCPPPDNTVIYASAPKAIRIIAIETMWVGLINKWTSALFGLPKLISKSFVAKVANIIMISRVSDDCRHYSGNIIQRVGLQFSGKYICSNSRTLYDRWFLHFLYYCFIRIHYNFAALLVHSLGVSFISLGKCIHVLLPSSDNDIAMNDCKIVFIYIRFGML